LLGLQAHDPRFNPLVCNIFDPTSHCENVKGGNAALLYIVLYSIALGMAGVKASIPPYGADQFDENDPRGAPKLSSFFNWVLLGTCIKGAFSMTLVVWIQAKVGWDWGFRVCAVGILLGTLVFAAGVPKYWIQVIGGTNPITEIIQVSGLLYVYIYCVYFHVEKSNISYLITAFTARYMLHPFGAETINSLGSTKD